ncbi:MAG TPA: patatin-like phospholipase family protein [Rhizobacter sp.]
MLRAARAWVAAAALLVPWTLQAQLAAPLGPTPAARPQVALVLSGGGARGGAHIGVLKALEELRVPVDMIVGTSAGSIVGAAYASGMPLAEIEREMKGLSTASLFRDVAREEAPYRRKVDDGYNYIGPEIGLSTSGLALPKGAVAGVSLEAVLRRLTRYQTSPNFDRLPIRFRAVATDIGNAEMVVIDHGPLALAARASMAIPGAVNPVEIDGRLLVDGGLKRNLPVDVARRMGADVVIAVNIGTPLLERERITSLLTVTDQVLRIITEENVMQSVRELTPRDLLITPELADITSADFDRLSDAARRGEAATRAMAGQLAALALSPDDYAALGRQRALAPGDTALMVDEVRVVGTRAVNPDVVLAAMDTQPGTPFDADRLDRDLKRIYSRGDFESVNYSLVNEPGTGRVLLVEVNEKSWGPHYLRVGLTLSSTFRGNAFFNLQASHRATWLNTLGAEWRNDLQLGQVGALRTEWYQPLSTAQRWFVAPRLELQDEPFDVYDDDSRQRVARFRRRTELLGLDVGVPLGTAGEARIGYVRGRLRFGDDTSLVPASLLDGDSRLAGVLTRLRIDKLDNLRFPRSGYAAELRVMAAHTQLGASDTYTKAELFLQGATHTGPHALRAALRAGGNLRADPLPDYELLQLGGFLNLSGYQNGQLLGREMRFGRLVYNYRLDRPGFFDGMYLGASLEFGRIGDAVAGPERSRLRRSNALYFALDTPLGPLYLAYGVGDGGNRTAYLFLGQP